MAGIRPCSQCMPKVRSKPKRWRCSGPTTYRVRSSWRCGLQVSKRRKQRNSLSSGSGFVGALNGKVAIVTGASRGIGRAIAEVFAREGARVAICGRKQETLDRAAAEIGFSVRAIACHVGRAGQIENLLAVTARELGAVDILVNNAATNISFGPCLEVEEAQFDKMIEINLKSAFRLVKAIAPGMCDRGSGSIINIASVAGLRPQRHSLLS